MDIVTLKEAKERGLSLYFTGEPCAHGHIGPRRTVNRSCYECFMAAKKRRDAERYADPEFRKREIARVGAWNKANPERSAARVKKWREENKERQLEHERRWREENPERWLESRRKRNRVRHVRKRANGGTFTQADLDALFARHKEKCGECRKKSAKLQIDHMIPVAKGGTSDPSNLQLLCPSCNRRKNAKGPIEWARENGRLL
jgi:5-methylcytosine-specific restriction endonuclease McrA